MIVIIDYGIGNLRSVQKSFNRTGNDAIISNDLNEIHEATKLVLPGVGNFKHAMINLYESGLLDKINHKVLDQKIPILGICLGMQMMTKYSEEGNVDGLGWIDASTKRFNIDKKVPHIGWGKSEKIVNSKLTNGIDIADEFYYVHSYYVDTNDKNLNLFESCYGHNFVSGFCLNNIYGVQFHPEKSYDAGLRLLSNFAKI